ncbi:MAG: hypothetical protein MUE80_02415 [Acidobacteria bacterium]|jgi:hypothetical protein|nr:hypothetical protein [Acidobacteriota bacterium]
MTEATLRALEGLRDLTTLKWYVIPLLAIVFYIYAREIKDARRSGNWDAVLAGLTLFGMDFFNETWNGWVLALTGRSAVWTAPGDTALRTMVGWNIEIMFMFALAGLVYYHTLSDDPKEKVLGLNNRWFWAVGYAAFCVFVEVLLNIGGLLIWEYPFWTRSFGGIWLIFLFGYFEFYAAIIFVLGLKKRARQVLAVALIYAVPVLMNIVGFGLLGWRY